MLFFILLMLIIFYNELLYINFVVFLTVKRGIVATNCFWHNISELFVDTSGVHIYKKLEKKYGRFIETNIFGTKIKIVTKIKDIQYILDNSPQLFGVGKLKYNFFKSFMKLNVGVSNGCPWKSRRTFNEHILNTNKTHQYMPYFDKYIRDILHASFPKNYKEFVDVGKKATMKIIFGEDKIHEPLFEMFKNTNKMSSIRNTHNDKLNSIRQFMSNYVVKQNCLMSLTKLHNNSEELLHQIPHWIFPINGLFSVHAPRLLLLLANHPHTLEKINHNYLRKCILELFRLNNPVNSTFRTLLEDHPTYGKRGDQFLILNNPILRSDDKFKNPHKFIPERWNNELEKSYYALMFNKGPQECPGKNLAIDLLKSIIINYLKIGGEKNILISQPSLDTKYIKQTINPCTIAMESFNFHEGTNSTYFPRNPLSL